MADNLFKCLSSLPQMYGTFFFIFFGNTFVLKPFHRAD